MVRHPFQKLCCMQPIDGQQPFLLAASGAIISSFNLKDGTLMSQWSRPEEREAQANGAASSNGQEEPPAKRRRVEGQNPADLSRQATDESVEIIFDSQKGGKGKPLAEGPQLSNVSHIIVTSDGATAIAVTTTDKSINVFAVRPGGVLDLQSQRTMPKKVSSIVLTADEKNIIVGDKFGDVYLLPLHHIEDSVPKKVESNQAPRPFSPSASELTVHTKRNLEALRQQQKQKAAQPKKEGPNFQVKLLLGHVSLLTDVAIAEVQDGMKRKQYILSADRDEHIRVSRGITQAHIIENYCLGHRDFVNKLCVTPWNPEFLVAGSAEPSLKVYHFQTARLLDQELFQGAVQQDITSALSMDDGERSLDRLVVSGIWPVHYTVAGNSPRSRHPPHVLLVAFEGLPLLLSYSLTAAGQLVHHQTLTLGGNVLDVGIGPALWDIVVSIDTVHKPGSMKIVRPEETPATEFFETFELFSNLTVDEAGLVQSENRDEPELRWERTSLAMLLNEAASSCKTQEVSLEAPPKTHSVYSPLGESLYGLENLRKKRGLQAQKEDAEAEGEPDAGNLEGGDEIPTATEEGA
ncbi:tRNA (guanine-N(7)-)-methyltransferase non-catalytic subunit TRM82 [Exophiala dermatitidis]